MINKTAADVKISTSDVDKYTIFMVIRFSDNEVLFQSLHKKEAIAYCKGKGLTFILDEVK